MYFGDTLPKCQAKLCEHVPLNVVYHLQCSLAVVVLAPGDTEHLHLGELVNPVQTLLLTLTASFRSVASRHGAQLAWQLGHLQSLEGGQISQFNIQYSLLIVSLG